MCQALDLAVYGLHVLEQKAYWAEQAVVKAAKNMLVVHSLSFETHLTSTPLDSTVSLGADVSIFGSRGQFKLEFNLADPLKNVHKLADTALEFFKKLFSPRPSKDVYDKPAEESDFEFSGVCARKNTSVEISKTKDLLLANRKTDKETGWFNGRLIDWLTDWLNHCMTYGLTEWLISWLTDFLTDFLTDRLPDGRFIRHLTDRRLTGRPNDWNKFAGWEILVCGSDWQRDN